MIRVAEVEETTEATVVTTVLRSVSELETLEDDWRSLLARCPDHTVFDTPDWLIPMAEEYRDRMRPLVIAVYERERLVGLAPFAKVRSARLFTTVRFLGMGPFGYPLSDYLDIIAARDKEQIVVAAVLERLRLMLGEWDMIDLQEIPETSRVLPAFLKQARELHWPQKVGALGSSFPLTLHETWEDFLRSISPSLRTVMERKARKLTRECQAEFKNIEGEEGLDAAMELFVRLHTAQWQSRGKGGLFNYGKGVDHFLTSAVRRLAKRGFVRLGVLTGVDGPLGVILSFPYRGTVYYYNAGYDPDVAYTKYSLGTMLLRYSIQTAVNNRETFNFLRGDGGYKVRYGASSVTHFRVRIWQRVPLFLATVALGTLRAPARRLAHGHSTSIGRLVSLAVFPRAKS